MKLQAKDFRIGNYIICIDEIKRIDLQDLQNMEEGLDFYKAVPISEELLIRFGLKENKNLDWFLPGYAVIEFLFEGGVIFYRLGVGINRKLKYAHQIQNLFYALTGEELELK